MDRAAELLRIRHAADKLYNEMGFSVLPCHHPEEPPPAELVATGAWSDDLAGKRPLVAWKKYQERRPALDEVRAWFYGDKLHNIAIVTGAISNIVVVDLDDERAVEWADKKLPVTPLRVRTSRGEHRYYRWDSTRPIGNSAGLLDDKLPNAPHADIRGEGGYVIAPGSRHKNGSLYLTTPNGANWKRGTLSDLQLFPHDLFQAEAKPQTAAVPRDDEIFLRKRLDAYMAQVPGHSEGERNNAGYHVAANLLWDWDAGDALAWEYFTAWNEKNSPPLAEKELRTIFGSAQKTGTHTRGWKRDLDRRRPNLRLVHSNTAPQTDGNLALAVEPRPQVKPKEELNLPMLDWNSIPAGSGWDFVLEPALPRGAVTILSGDGGLGKSLLACLLVTNLAAGVDLLGKSLSKKFRSTVFFLEDAVGEVKRRLCDTGYQGDGSINIFDNRQTCLSLSKSHVKAVAKTAKEHGSDLVVLDPLVSAAASADIDVNDPKQVRAIVDFLTIHIAKELDMAVLLVHHHNAGGTILGGKAWSNAVRSHLAVYRHPLDRDRYLLLHAKNNCGEMVTHCYQLQEAHAGVRDSVIAKVVGPAPTWNYQRLRELSAQDRFQDHGNVREAMKFLKLQIRPGMRKQKKDLVNLAAADGIRINDLNQAAAIIGLKRDYVPQPNGQPDILCWEMPVDTIE